MSISNASLPFTETLIAAASDPAARQRALLREYALAHLRIPLCNDPERLPIH